MKVDDRESTSGNPNLKSFFWGILDVDCCGKGNKGCNNHNAANADQDE